MNLLGLFWKIEFAKFHVNRLIIDGEINEKHLLLDNSGAEFILSNVFFD